MGPASDAARRDPEERRTQARGHRREPHPLRVGVIGVGNMGRHHARAYTTLGGLCELHGLYDPDADRVRTLGDRWHARAYDDVDALLADVDAVTIASPSRFHLEHALAALAAGVHVLIEKPLGLTVGEAEEIAAAATAAPGVVVQVGHIEHFNPAIGELRKLLHDQTVVAIDIHRLSPYDGRITDADVVQDLMLHDIHVVLSVASSPLVAVHTAGRPVRSAQAVDYAVTNLVFEDGMIATLSASRVTEEKIRRLTVTTTDSHVTMDYMNRTIERCRWARMDDNPHDERSYRQESFVERIYVPQEEPLLAELRSFLECVRDGTRPEVTVQDGVRCLEVVDRIRQGSCWALKAPAGTLPGRPVAR